MEKYQKGKIYKITSTQLTKCYVGSTVSPLSIRFSQHKHRYLKGTENPSATELMKYDDAKIELVEDYPCGSKKELFAREGHWIKELDCVNVKIAGRTRVQYYQDNKQKINDNAKQYYQNNLVKMKQAKKAYYESNKDALENIRGSKIKCDICNREFRKDSISRHNKSKLHLSNLG